MKKKEKLQNNDFVDMMVKKAYSSDHKPEPYKPTIIAKKDHKAESYAPKITTKKDDEITPYKGSLNIEEIEELTEKLKGDLATKKPQKK